MPTKKERLAQRKADAAANKARKAYEAAKSKTPPTEEEKKELTNQLGQKTVALRKEKAAIYTWIRTQTVGGDVEVRGYGSTTAHFAGQNSSALNVEWTRKHRAVSELEEQIERLKNRIDPGRKRRLERENLNRDLENASKMLFWSTLDSSGRERAKAQKAFNVAKKKVEKFTGDNLTIKPQCVGTFIAKAKSGYPENIRCYHSRGNDCNISCDCTHEDDGTLTLSEESKKLLACGELNYDDMVLKQQQLALFACEVGESIPNIYLEGGPRPFDPPLWKRSEAAPDEKKSDDSESE